MCYRMISKDAEKARATAGEVTPDADRALIATAEAAQQADKAAFARFVARLAQWRAEARKKAGEPVS